MFNKGEDEHDDEDEDSDEHENGNDTLVYNFNSRLQSAYDR